MDKKIVIIGGIAGGASAAARLRRHSEADEIIMFEKGPHVSFSNCALPYHLSGAVEPANKLVLMNPEKFFEQGQVFIDVRAGGEYERGHLEGAKNIPLSELRQRVDEIPTDKPVYIHCRTGQRSYNAVLALQNLGYKNVVNVTGGFLGLSFYEYFKDQVGQRNPIMTAYNFN